MSQKLHLLFDQIQIQIQIHQTSEIYQVLPYSAGFQSYSGVLKSIE